MAYIYVPIVVLTIIGVVGFVVGYFVGLYKGINLGFDDGFKYGSNYILKKTVHIMDKSGSLLTYCDALKNEAIRQGMSKTQIEDLMKETMEMLPKE